MKASFSIKTPRVGNAVERLADALSQRNVTVIKSTSFDDGFAILSSTKPLTA
ncbi:hypothetical protein ACNKHU_25545 [Shigella flexneri]